MSSSSSRETSETGQNPQLLMGTPNLDIPQISKTPSQDKRLDHRQPMYRQSRSSNPGPRSHKKSLDQLYAERNYLLGVLQEENDKATEFLRRVQPLESSLPITTSSSLRRSLKKQVGWLKHRITETGRQERSILTRLGQLAYEIQTLQRESQIQYERILGLRPEMNYGLNPVMDHMKMGPALINNPTLSALTPAFHPQGCILQPTSAPSQTRFYDDSSQYRPVPFSKLTPEMARLQYNGNEFPFPRQTPEDDNSDASPDILQRHMILHRCSSMSSVDFNGSSSNTTLSSSPFPRRRSLQEPVGSNESSGQESRARTPHTPSD